MKQLKIKNYSLIRQNKCAQGTLSANSSKEAVQKVIKKNLKIIIKMFMKTQPGKLYKSKFSNKFN